MFDLFLYHLKRPYHFIKTGLLKGLVSQIRTKHPERQLQIIMVTGTDGKTTTATLLHHVLNQAKIQTGLISTVEAKIGNKHIESGLHVTAPQPDELYQLLRQMVSAGCSHAVIEMTSHGGYQYRNWGLRPQLGIITNITPEHLDYHVTLAEYAKAKLRLFPHTPKVFMHRELADLTQLIKCLRSDQCAFVPSLVKLPVSARKSISDRFSESYNQKNATLVWSVANELGVTDQHFAQALTSFEGVPGRMQWLPTKTNFRAVVDFAHTPAGVEAVLKSLRTERKLANNKGKIIVVLGCAGLRDRSKRPVMGEIATRLADFAIFTAEDPRTESVWNIIREMKEQLSENHDAVVSIADRGEAIHFALTKLAKKGDVVAFLGKGHEQSMCLGQIEYPWSDVEAVQAVLKGGIIPRVGEWQPEQVSH